MSLRTSLDLSKPLEDPQDLLKPLQFPLGPLGPLEFQVNQLRSIKNPLRTHKTLLRPSVLLDVPQDSLMLLRIS